MLSLRNLASCVLASLLVVESMYAQQPGAAETMQQHIAALPAKAYVVVHLTDGSTVRGRIVTRSDQDFALKSDNGGAPQTIAYKQVTAMEQAKQQHSKAKWIVIGVVAGAAVVVAVIAIHVVHSPTINGI